MLSTLKQAEVQFDKLSDESTELAQSSGESRINVTVQQISSRVQSVQATTRELAKKCEQAVNDHKAFNDKYQQCSDWIAAAQARFDSCQQQINAGARSALADSSKVLDELLSQQITATLLLNDTVELGEKLFPTTSVEGREAISNQLREIQQALEALYDNVGSTERELKAKLHRYNVYLLNQP